MNDHDMNDEDLADIRTAWATVDVPDDGALRLVVLAPVRTVMIKGEPWWVAADVCAVLES
jgi:hypothetical protein